MEWSTARETTFAQHPLAIYLRTGAPLEIQSALLDHSGISVKGSAGAGQWAAVPWLAVFEDIVTNTATQGYYVVYLFHPTSPLVYLSLNQGTTAIRAEFKNATHDALTERAQLIRRRLRDFASRLPVTSIDLGSSAGLPGDYAAGHAIGLSYSLTNLPSEDVLVSDLQASISAYRTLTFRGGLDTTAAEAGEDGPPTSATLIEQRRYKMHQRIERNSRAAAAAKKYHGLQCQGCGLEFEKRYGELGIGFIEAHHLKALASLNEGEPVSYDISKDFAVLCSNCHRMIHRTADPSDLHAFRRLLLP
ncbi:MrcB family domain-containing protein [Tardiphaga sp. 604_B6_N1_1]|uniref:MrcB family domain-containing protein n=1 Tax=Tardiphaga sp. 604_B6_N1_1 TaxID=3240779 RepID=UPI003F200A75